MEIDRKRGISPPPPPTSSKKRRRSTEAGAPAARAHNEARSDSTPTQWLRIFSWNVNGISPFLQSSITSFMNSGHGRVPDVALRAFLHRHHWPQIVQLQEVKINPTDVTTLRAVERAVNRRLSDSDDGPDFICRFCLPRDKYNATGFGRRIYGVLTILRRDFYSHDVERIREVDWDLEGRVLVVETRTKLSIWNIYAVNGTDKSYRDPDTGQVCGSRHDRKLAFHEHLLRECRELEERGFRVILCGDFNVAPASIDAFPQLRTHPFQHVLNRRDFNAKFLAVNSPDSLCAVDAFRFLHPNRRSYTWVSRTRAWLASCDRVDYILLSRTFVDNANVLREANVFMTEQERGPSDHVPISISLDLGELKPPDAVRVG